MKTRKMKLAVALLFATGIAGQDAADPNSIATLDYDDDYAGDYYYYDDIDGLGRSKRGKKKSKEEREAAKAAREKAKAEREAAKAAANNYAPPPDTSTTKTTTTSTPYYTTGTTTPTTPYYTTEPTEPSNPYAPAGPSEPVGPSNPYANGGKNEGDGDDTYGNNPYSNAAAANGAAINFGAYNENPNEISCFHCDAKNFTECYEIGMNKPCRPNQGTCMIEIRQRDGVMEGVCMGCKQISAQSQSSPKLLEGNTM